MNTYILFGHRVSCSKLRFTVLAFFWLSGFVGGIFLALSFSSSSTAFLREVLSRSASPLLSFFIAGLPIAISALALWYPAFYLNCPLVFLNAVCRGFNGMLIHTALCSGAWLIRFFYLFSSSSISVLMWWLLLRHIDTKGSAFSKDIRFVSILSCFIIIIDILIISPFLTDISKYI